MEVKFINHLIENGIIDYKTGNHILSLYYEKSPNYKTNKMIFNELMTEILLIIINNLNDIQKKYMCFHLPVKFIKLTEKFKKEKLRNILIKKILKNKYILAKYIIRWNAIIFNNIKKIYSYNNTNFQRINTSNDYSKNDKISKCIKEFCDNNNYNNTNKRDDNFYLTLNNEKRSKTYDYSKENFFTSRDNNIENFIKNKNNQNYIKIKNLINKTNKNNKIYKNNQLLKNINYINYINDNIINKKRTNYINISNLKDSYETNNNLLSTNSNTISNKFRNTIENNLPLNQKYERDFNIVDSYNMKKYKNNQSNSSNSKNIKEKIINNFIKNEMKKLKIQNFIEENFKNEDSFSPLSKIYKRNNLINNKLLCNTCKNIENNNNIVKTYYSNIFHPPFCENIKQSFPKNNIPVYNRLFEDGINRLRKQKQKKLEQDKYLDDLSNQVSGEKKIVDYNRINELYKNKRKSKTFEKTKAKVEQEEGLTFSPSIKENKYIKRIYSNFMERNYYNKYINEYNNDYFNYDLKSQKKMTNKQKERIINRIIDKLNMNSDIKNISDNCNKYTKEVNHNSKSHKKKL